MLKAEQPLPIYAVISNNNSGNTLLPLLSSMHQPDSGQRPYDGVVVVDGDSTDNSQEIVESFQAYGANLHWIGLQAEVGSSNLKNKGAEHVSEEVGHAILHFVEADMELAAGVSAPTVAEDLLKQPDVAFVGGLINNPDGNQHALNYGPQYSLKTYGKAAMQQFAGSNQRLHNRYLQDFPDQKVTPTARPVSWVMERNMLITTSMFDALGGFDPKFRHRHHDAQPLAVAAARQGLDVLFDPQFPMTQLESTSDRLQPPRISQMLYADALLISRHVGWRNFIRPPKSQK